MIDPPKVAGAPIGRRPWLVLAAAVSALGLMSAVAADSQPSTPEARTTSDDALYRQFENEGHIPRPARVDVLDVTRRLVNEGLIPSG